MSEEIKTSAIKISKIMLHPKRTIDMGTRGYITLDAGVELDIDPPAVLGSPEIEKAFEEGRKLVIGEFKKQYEPYIKSKTEGGDK